MNHQNIADESTPVPGGFSSFTGFGHVAIDPSHVAFEGFSADSHGNPVKGIYTDFGGSLAKVTATGDSIGGSIVTDVNMGPAGFSGSQIAFQAAYSDGSQGFYSGARRRQSLPAEPGLLEKSPGAVAGNHANTGKPELQPGRAGLDHQYVHFRREHATGAPAHRGQAESLQRLERGAGGGRHRRC